MGKSVEELIYEARNYLLQVQRYIKGLPTDNLVKVLVFAFYVYYKCNSRLPVKRKREFKRLFEGALHILNLDPQVKEIMPAPLVYKIGKEVEIINNLKRIPPLLEKAEKKKKQEIAREENELKEKQLARAFTMIEKSRMDGALGIFNELSSKFSDDYQLHKKISQKLLEINHIECLTFLERTVKINPKDAGSYATLGQVLHKLKRYDAAIKAQIKSVQIDRSNTNYMFELAQSYIDNREWSKAKEVLTRLLKLDPNMGPAQEALKSVSRLFRAGDW